MKKLIALFLVIVIVFAFTGCGANPEKMEWEGYSGTPFKEMLEKGISKKLDMDVNVSIKTGWETSELDDDGIDKAYTFVVDPEDENFVIDSYEFFMAVEDNELVVKGAVAHSNGDDDFLKEESAFRQLKSVAEELE